MRGITIIYIFVDSQLFAKIINKNDKLGFQARILQDKPQGGPAAVTDVKLSANYEKRIIDNGLSYHSLAIGFSTGINFRNIRNEVTSTFLSLNSRFLYYSTYDTQTYTHTHTHIIIILKSQLSLQGIYNNLTNQFPRQTVPCKEEIRNPYVLVKLINFRGKYHILFSNQSH